MGQTQTRAVLSKDELEKLHAETGYSFKKLKALQAKFLRHADPKGLILKADFQAVMRTEGYSGPLYEELMFRAMDTDNNEQIDVNEFIVGMAFLGGKKTVNTPEEAAAFVFGCYDADRSGSISRDEMTSAASAVYRMLHAQIVDTVSKWKSVAEFVDAMFAKFDLDNDQVITYEEFLRVVKGDEDVLNILLHPFGEEAEETSAQLKEDLDLDEGSTGSSSDNEEE